MADRLSYDLMTTKFFGLGWLGRLAFSFFFFFLIGWLVIFLSGFFFLLQFELCKLDQLKTQICYRTWFLAEIIAADSSISQCPLGKPNWHQTHLRRLKKELKHRH